VGLVQKKKRHLPGTTVCHSIAHSERTMQQGEAIEMMSDEHRVKIEPSIWSFYVAILQECFLK